MRNLVIVNMILSVINIILGVGTGNWTSAIGWGVALMWQIMCFKQLED
jgi:hypothetical protein